VPLLLLSCGSPSHESLSCRSCPSGGSVSPSSQALVLLRVSAPCCSSWHHQLCRNRWVLHGGQPGNGRVGPVPWGDKRQLVFAAHRWQRPCVPGLLPAIPTVPPLGASSGVRRSPALHRDTKLGDFSLSLAPGEGLPAQEEGAQIRCTLPSAPIPCSQPPNLLLCTWHYDLSQ